MFDHGKNYCINPKISTEGFEFKSAMSAIDKPGLVCWGYMIYKSQYGTKVALAANDNTFYTLPARYTEEFQSISDENRNIFMAGGNLEFKAYETAKGKTVDVYINGERV